MTMPNLMEAVIYSDRGKWSWRIDTRDGAVMEDSPGQYDDPVAAVMAAIVARDRWNRDALLAAQPPSSSLA